MTGVPPAGGPPRRFVLASASPARLRLLRDAGFDPVVRVSGVDEEAVTAPDPASLAGVLARAKAAAVAAAEEDALVLGCDSVLDVDGEAQGKPASPEQAVARWGRLAGREAVLVTGHALLDVRAGRVVAERSATDSAVVRFGTPRPEELAAYVASGEPTRVAGGFTLDGRGGLFVRGIRGSSSTVVGLCLPLLRDLLDDLGTPAVTLWRAPEGSVGSGG